MHNDPTIHTKYKLISNIVHDGKPEEGSYKSSVFMHRLGVWMEMQNLYTREILETLVQASQAYVLFFERIDG